MIALVGVLLLASCGATAATTATPTPTPRPIPSRDTAGLYLDAIQKTHDSLVTDYAAIAAAKVGSAEEATAAGRLAGDYQNLLDMLDAIPFPPNAQQDLSDLKKSLVALQIFWSQVSNDTNSYNSFSQTSLEKAYGQAALVLGHDIGVSLIIPGTSPSPTP